MALSKTTEITKQQAEEAVSSSPNENFDEVTYEHKLYKGVNLQNPSLGYAWIVFPSYANDYTTFDEYNEKLREFTVKLKELNNKEDYLYITPQNLISFHYNYVVEGFGTFSFQLYDSQYTDVEEKILKNGGFIAFQYGYGNNRNLASPWVHGMIVGYSIKFELEGTIISFNGVAQGWTMNVAKEAIPYTVVDEVVQKNISEKETPPSISTFVDELAKRYGFKEDWQRVIEPTVQVISRGVGLKDNEPTHIKLSSTTADTCFEHILRNVRKFATSTDPNNSGNYVFYVDQTNEGPILHFHTLKYKYKNKNDAEPGGKQEDLVKLFTLFKNPNTVVREFIPDWNISTAQIRGPNRMVAIGYDPLNKVVLTQEATIKNAASLVTTPDGNQQSKLLQLTGQEQSTDVILSGSAYQASMEQALKTKFETNIFQANTATLEIQGTHGIQLLETVAVHVYIPKGSKKTNQVTKEQQVHWISGKFTVIGIEQRIDKGDFRTILKLCYSGRKLFIEKGASTTVGKQGQ